MKIFILYTYDSWDMEYNVYKVFSTRQYALDEFNAYTKKLKPKQDNQFLHMHSTEPFIKEIEIAK